MISLLHLLLVSLVLSSHIVDCLWFMNTSDYSCYPSWLFLAIMIITFSLHILPVLLVLVSTFHCPFHCPLRATPRTCLNGSSLLALHSQFHSQFHSLPHTIHTSRMLASIPFIPPSFALDNICNPHVPFTRFPTCSLPVCHQPYRSSTSATLSMSQN